MKVKVKKIPAPVTKEREKAIKVVIDIKPKEIADLISALQGQRNTKKYDSKEFSEAVSAVLCQQLHSVIEDIPLELER